MSSTLREKATSGVLWSAFERFSQQGVGFLVQIVLARLLAPEQFGLIAMVAVFVALCQGIADAGFHEAIIQKKELNDSLISTVFFTNLQLACFLTLGLWFGAPFVADFYGQDQLTILLRVLSIALIIDGFARIQLTLLQRGMLFRKLATATFVATVVSGIIAVVLAVLGLGVWALVVQVLLQRLVVASLLWGQSEWRPTLEYSLNCLKEVLPFASRMFASNLLNNVFKQIYVLFIGRVGSPVELGYYQRADSFKQLASSASNTLMARVTFPLFARVQDEPARLRRGFLRACQLLSFIFFPLMAILAAVSEPLIATLIGEKWLPAVPYLQLLCIVGALHPVHAINLSLIKALGQGGLFLRLEIIKKCIIAAVLFMTFRHGVYVVIIGQVFCNFLGLAINAYYTHRLIDVSYWQQLRVFLGAIAVSLSISYCVLAWILPLLRFAPFLNLVVGIAASGVIWLLGVYGLRRFFVQELQWFSGELVRMPFLKSRFS